ncbi:hypothetical protein KP509_1Z056800 [Ceratopteris richardii]|nr:hypothetical protein KP509_1Z056800 [Ceratopteris richardii]
MQSVHFDFNSTPFELHDDAFVLKAMGLSKMLKCVHNCRDVSGEFAKPDHAEPGTVPSLRHKRHATLLKNTGSPSNCLSVPGILKSRVKQEYHY